MSHATGAARIGFRGRLRAAAYAALLVPCTALADGTERCSRIDALAAQPSTTEARTDPALEAAMTAEATRQLPAVDVPEPDLAAATAVAHEALRFSDHRSLRDRLARLKKIRALALLRLWDDRRVQVYIGVDRAGTAGLHFRQRSSADDGELATLAAFATPVPLQAPPLRAVPLAAY